MRPLIKYSADQILKIPCMEKRNGTSEEDSKQQEQVPKKMIFEKQLFGGKRRSREKGKEKRKMKKKIFRGGFEKNCSGGDVGVLSLDKNRERKTTPGDSGQHLDDHSVIFHRMNTLRQGL